MTQPGFIRSFLSRYQYPHRVFAAALKRAIVSRSGPIEIIDAPCGNGEVALLLSGIRNVRLKGFDISETSVAYAREICNSPNSGFIVKDIHVLFDSQVDCDYYCMVNSLFLLPGPEELLKKIFASLKPGARFLLIIPNTVSENYRRFVHENPSVNVREYTLDEISSSLSDKGFRIVRQEGLARVPRYGRKDIRRMSLFAPFYLLFLNYMQSMFHTGTPGYYLIVAEKP